MENESQLMTQQQQQQQQKQDQQQNNSDKVENGKKIELSTRVLSVSNGHGGSHFDLHFVCDAFLRSIEDKSAIDVILYLQGFGELNKFFNMFGTLFSFVTKDVQAKIGILHSYAEDKAEGFNYSTIQSMIEYEKSRELLKDQKRPSGARTLLRLHRALEFISQFLHEVTKIEDEASTVGSARNAYNRTLAKFHPWYIRKSVQVATFALPYRKVLVERVYGGKVPPGGSKEVNENMSHLANIADQVFNATHKLYEEHSLLDLP